ncbi:MULTISPECIES: hypothetical protein [Burkholderia]|uniref:hypothetical protein n=1 Tax=Burkholderia TaxID=32008 RepID=UPI001F197C3A|nr:MULTISPECIES: hypothetical protein [Burkholderia]MCH7273426.1 hypothetical protein [Burkholderia gladioli]MDN7736555.1 hypothetical protein [Burkholderia gladioli]MDZ4041079.1 hypothetical protein [Burkholderia gladioli pv. alliicola]MEB2551062.1 hypothetical protein [Burkholderia gladioli]
MTSVATFQPLFPEDRVLDGSIERAATLIDKARRLLKADDTPLAAALVPQLRSMNSYYTNKIEGQHTTPGKIEAALRRDYSPDADEYRKQRHGDRPYRRGVRTGKRMARGLGTSSLRSRQGP